jgi:hypothetical protein
MMDAQPIIHVYLYKPLVHFAQILGCTNWTCF